MKAPIFPFLLAGKAKMCYRIKNVILLLYALEIDLMQSWQQKDLDML